MGFLGVYRAIYDYAPQAEGELAITDGDLLYVLDNKGDDGWWRAKKKAGADDEDEPVGLVPNNYVEQAKSLGQARALYEYTRQTDEELSFPDDTQLDVFDISDPDWILVGLDGEYGFVPSNYIEMEPAGKDATPTPSPPAPPSLPARPQLPSAQPDSPIEAATPLANPAAALAGVMHGRTASQPALPPPQPSREPVSYQEREESDEEPVRSPALPARPRPSGPVSPTYDDPTSPVDVSSPVETFRTPGGFHMYNINEMVSVMGKRKKMPTTLGINLGTGTILIAPERASDGPTQEWTADRMTHYSREGKHVFLELVRPSKSVDFHAGAKDTAEEIVNGLGEMAGAVRAEGLREVIMAGSGQSQKKGQILYDFMAQGDDEVTVAVGDEVIVIDDTKSDEWWQVRRVKNGKEGVVPSSYIEITGSITPPAASSGINSAKSIVEQNRLEEIRLTKEAITASNEPQQVGPGMHLPERGSSLTARENGSNSGQQRSRRENGRNDAGSHNKSKSKPDSSKVRTWTDRSRSFSVEAQFLGVKDGKIHLHKMNGVKIAVPITKMSREDLEYVENITGISLDDEKPLADVKRARSSEKKAPEVGASIAKPQKPEYDWFQFFLSCEVAVGLCERYAQAFIKDSMDESVLPDVDASTLRTLGLREGDIIKVMRSLDAKYGRNRGGKRNVSFASEQGADGEGSSGGLFSGPGGTLRNNTRKGRPAPAVQTSDVVDVNAFSKPDQSSVADDGSKSPAPSSPTNNIASDARQSTTTGFDDDAWDVKPSKKQHREPQVSTSQEVKPKAAPQTSPTSTTPPASQPLTGSMKELSLLTAPLQPTKTEPTTSQPAAVTEQPSSAAPPPQQQQQLQQQLPGASPSFFSAVSQSQQPPQNASFGGHASPQSLLRQRPAPPQISSNQGSLVPPPPQRPLSAPQAAPASAFAPPPMVPQMTGSIQSQVAPPGQSLNEISQARLQQQYTAQMLQSQQPPPQLQPAMTGYPTGPGMMPFQSGNPAQFMQPMMTGLPGQVAFSQLQPQSTGFQSPFAAPPQHAFGQAPAGGINSYLPPALEPQRTGMPSLQPGLQPGLQPQITGMPTMGGINGPVPQPLQPLQPQQTGPPPPVRFGMTGEAQKLAPQPTGRRANLAHATPQNPFGF